ncbi:hypothetical protein [Leucobacter sp. M11]|uniref:hypothetical protein n=1 Tax=Leucobacter sp. M11 TaxID=2993565 RepID=UPI002D7F4E40|nr:hypothetical protein [Leucobacter sp. M11]MEB4613996.1 hypothetical protein [Leucobacter sp. M11]
MSDDLDRLVHDLGEFPKHAGRFVEAALKGTAHGMKEDWQELAKGPSGGHAKRYPQSIDYEITQSEFPHFSAEVGPDLGRTQGPLGILEEANGGVKAAPQNLRASVVRANETDFVRGMEKARDDALRRAGL